MGKDNPPLKPGPKSKKLAAAAAAVTNRLTAPSSAKKDKDKEVMELDKERDVAPPAKRNKQLQVQDKGRKVAAGGEGTASRQVMMSAVAAAAVPKGKENQRKKAEGKELPPLGWSDDEEEEEGERKGQEEMELGEPEGRNTGLEVHQILSQVGTDFQKQMAAKKKRIENCFKGT